MPRPILRLRHAAPGCLLAMLAMAGQAEARSASMRIERVTTAVATLHDVRVRLDWPDGAAVGDLQVSAGRIEADGLGYRLRGLAWRCPLSRDAEGLRCNGTLTQGGHRARLAVDLRSASTRAVLSSGATRFALQRTAAAPDDTVLDLARVPLAWAQALSSQAWAGGRLQRGTLDGQLVVEAPTRGPLRVHGTLDMADVALDTADASIAAENLAGRVRLDYRAFPARTLLALDATLRGGELLAGSAYVALPPAPVRVALDGQLDAGQGWVLPRLAWDDGSTLRLDGSAVLDADGGIRTLDLSMRSDDASALPSRYLSGWLGPAGLGALELQGALGGALQLHDGVPASFALQPRALSLRDPGGGFGLTGLDGELRHVANGQVDSLLRWRNAHIGAVAIGPASLPFRSDAGVLALREDVDIPLLGGRLRLDGFQLRPPTAGTGLRMQAGLALEALDLGTLATALGAPAFRGTLGGRIPMARYADERLVFDGGLAMDVFDGRVRMSSLAMERPFGVAPTLSADLDLEGLDLLAITEVFDFGSITGRLDGRIAGLRLVDWTPTAFDASFRTVPRKDVPQRISQRAVQNISSVGDASFVGTLQGQLIGLFDDFGYRRIGIGCRLDNTVCTMSGLGPAGDGFTLVDGSGLPRLHVVGFNRRVDWATLVERLAAVGSGEVSPVIE